MVSVPLAFLSIRFVDFKKMNKATATGKKVSKTVPLKKSCQRKVESRFLPFLEVRCLGARWSFGHGEFHVTRKFGNDRRGQMQELRPTFGSPLLWKLWPLTH